MSLTFTLKFTKNDLNLIYLNGSILINMFKSDFTKVLKPINQNEKSRNFST